jgi:hypothetical protein
LFSIIKNLENDGKLFSQFGTMEPSWSSKDKVLADEMLDYLSKHYIDIARRKYASDISSALEALKKPLFCKAREVIDHAHVDNSTLFDIVNLCVDSKFGNKKLEEGVIRVAVAYKKVIAGHIKKNKKLELLRGYVHKTSM